MSFDLIFWINEYVFSEEKYFQFLQECRKIEGNWKLTETHSFDAKLCSCYRDEYHTECYLTQEVHLSGFENNDEEEGELVSILVHIYKERDVDVNFQDNEKYKVYIDIETGAGRGFLALAIQFLIPLKAFEFFKDVVVVDQLTSKVYFNSDEYLIYVRETLSVYFKCENVYQKYFLK